ncbi:hypothetical protein AB0G05_13275 [Nonomuraea wenchangensis]
MMSDDDVSTLLRWINAPDWESSRRILREHPELLDEPAERDLLRQTAARRQAKEILILEDHHLLLTMSREMGIERGYEEYLRLIAASSELRAKANAAQDAYTRSGDLAALDGALTDFGRIVTLWRDGPASRRRAALLDKGLVHERRYQAAGRPEDLDAALEDLDRARLVPGAAPGTRAFLTHIVARLHRMHFERYRRPAHLAAAIDLLSGTLESLPEDSTTVPDLLNGLGEALRLRHGLLGNPLDLDAAITSFNRATSWTRGIAARLPALLTGTGTGLVERYQLTGDPADLDQAVAAFGEAVERFDGSPADLSAHLINLGGALMLRHARSGDPADLERARQVLERAEGSLPAEAPLRPTLHGTLAAYWQERYALTGDRAMLEQGITHAERALAAASVTGHDRPANLDRLAHLLLARAEHDGADPRSGDRDVERAVELYREALKDTPVSAARRPARAMALGSGLAARYLRAGRAKDLDDALAFLRQAVRAGPRESVNAVGALFNLGNALWVRYERTGSLEDLDAAVRIIDEVVPLIPDGSPDSPRMRNSFATVLAARFMHEGAAADITRCADVLREVVAGTPADSPARATYLNNLSNALILQAVRLNVASAAGEAVETLRDGLRSAKVTAAGRATLNAALARALLTRMGRRPDLRVLDEAIALVRSALAATGAAAPDAIAHAATLARALRIRSTFAEHRDDVSEGMATFRQVCERGLVNAPDVTLDAASDWTAWAAGRGVWHEAADAVDLGLRAARRLWERQVLRANKERWLRRVGALHATASMVYLQDPRYGARGAVEALEGGRAVILAERLERDRADLDRLGAAGRQDLVERYRRAAHRLSELSAEADEGWHREHRGDY